MKSITGTLRNAPYALLAAATIALGDMSNEALAGTGANTIGGIADKAKGQISQVGQFVVGGAVLIGVGFVAAGLMKLKQAADTQGQQVKYGEGIWRLVVGAGLVAVPALTGILGASFGLEGAKVNAGDGF